MTASFVGEDVAPITASLPGLSFVGTTDWRDDAKCKTLPKAVFFDYNAIGVPTKVQRQYKATALKTCATCPVRDKCLEFAVKNNEKYGIWAGMMPKERLELYEEFKSTGTVGTPAGW